MENQDEIKHSISFMGDFVNLFMAVYTLDSNNTDDNNVYISKNFKEIISLVLYYISVNNVKFNSEYIYNSNGIINIDEFIKYFKTASIKKFWQEKYKYDFDRDCIVVEIKKSDAKKEIEKYDSTIVQTMTLLLDYYKYIENESTHNEHIEQAAFEIQKEISKKYEYSIKESLDKKSDD